MHALIVTLMTDPVRALNSSFLKTQLEGWGFHVTQIEAVDYQTTRFREIPLSQDTHLTAGEIACAYSHRLAYQKMIELGKDCLILEDDAYFESWISHKDFEHVEHVKLLCNLNDQFEAGNKSIYELVQERERDHITKGLPWGTQGYYATVEGAKILLEHSNPIVKSSDHLLHHLSWEGHLKTLLSKTQIVRQNPVIRSFIGTR